MIGSMMYNDLHQAAGEFIPQAFEAAQKRLGSAPGLALVNLAGDDLALALEAAGVPCEKAPWILPNHVYFVRSVENG